MTVKNLIEELKKQDPNKEVWISQLWSEFDNAPVNKVEENKIKLTQEPGDEEIMAELGVVLLTDFV